MMRRRSRGGMGMRTTQENRRMRKGIRRITDRERNRVGATSGG
jgi:hypothetical protein